MSGNILKRCSMGRFGLLTLLKYAGLVIAAASAIWGTTSEMTTVYEGRKRLTHAGYIAICFTVFGLLISVVSNILEDTQKVYDQNATLLAEVKRTNRIIMSSQPLTSLGLFWDINITNLPLQKLVSSSHEEVMAEAGNKQGNTWDEGDEEW